MEKSYIINDTSIGRNTRSYQQRTNDVNALSFLAVITADDGNDKKAALVAIRNFFDEKKYLPSWNDGGASNTIRKSLIKIQKNWSKYKDSAVLNYVSDYVIDKMSKFSNINNDSNQWITFKKYYTNDKNRAYFSFEKLFSDIAEGNIEDENKAIEEFDSFTNLIEKESGLKSEDENA